MTPTVQPLSYRHRNVFFYLLMGIFIAALPFLFLYATGYRFSFLHTSLISTGGLYIAAERTGAEIYIDNELVRETRAFRRAFYAQGLAAGTHRVHVQKEGHHTWVKELPVYPHLVTEAQAFTLPLVPQVRVVTPYRTPAGVAVMTSSSTVLESAAVQNQVLIETRAATSTMVADVEFAGLVSQFGTTTAPTAPPVPLLGRQGPAQNAATGTATTTKEFRGVRLYEDEGKIYARYVGTRNSMPYYYCTEPFAPYVASTTVARGGVAHVAEAKTLVEDLLELEVQTVQSESVCEPVVEMDTFGEDISYFDFFPNSTDLVILAGESGIYVSEIDDRAWQNRQPLLMGENLEVRVINGTIYAYDGRVIYQILMTQTWF